MVDPKPKKKTANIRRGVDAPVRAPVAIWLERAAILGIASVITLSIALSGYTLAIATHHCKHEPSVIVIGEAMGDVHP